MTGIEVGTEVNSKLYHTALSSEDVEDFVLCATYSEMEVC
jgi:hypothetical protein